MHILFVTEKWCDGKREFGLTNHFHNLYGSLASTGLATYDTLHVDELDIDTALPEYVSLNKGRLNAIIYCFLGTSGLNPKIPTIEKVKDVPMCFIFPDIVYNWIGSAVQKVEPYAKVLLSFDSFFEMQGLASDKFMTIATPQDPALFYQDEKKTDVSFVGTLAGYPDRNECINYLLDNGQFVKVTGGQRSDTRLSPQDYAREIRQSKISINFSRSHEVNYQCKGRVFEITASNVMLLESKNVVTPRFYTPGVDYIEFDGCVDLGNKINFYLENEHERIRIATNGYNKFQATYTAKMLWQQVFNKLFDGVKLL